VKSWDIVPVVDSLFFPLDLFGCAFPTTSEGITPFGIEQRLDLSATDRTAFADQTEMPCRLEQVRVEKCRHGVFLLLAVNRAMSIASAR
jgi:hypothetical protein